MNPTDDHEINDRADQRVIDQVLADVEPENADSLRPLLAELRTLAHGEPVAPGPLLETLLLPEQDDAAASPTAHAETPAPTPLRLIDGERRTGRPLRRRRPLAAAVILAAAIGAGTAAAAAADEGFRSTLNDGIGTIVGVLGGHPAQAPASPAAPAQPAPVPTTVAQQPGTQGASTSAPASSPGVEAPRTTTQGSTASPSPSASRPGLPTHLPSPDLGLPLPQLPVAPGSLPQPASTTGDLPGSLR